MLANRKRQLPIRRVALPTAGAKTGDDDEHREGQGHDARHLPSPRSNRGTPSHSPSPAPPPDSHALNDAGDQQNLETRRRGSQQAPDGVDRETHH